MSFTLTAMRYFVEVARCENVTAAAARLYTAQPNLSKSISGLERSLGVELLRRDGRYVRLTDAGKLLYREWSQALEQIDRSVLQVQKLEEARTNGVTIGILEGMNIASGAAERFKELQRLSPGVTIRLERGDLKHIWREFEAGRYDLIVTSELRQFPRAVPPSCVRHVADTCPGVAAINRENPLAGHSALTLSMLREESFVSLSRSYSPEGYAILREACRQAGFEPRVTQEASTFETLILYVEMGVGAAILGENNRLAIDFNIRLIPLKDIRFDTVVYWRAGPLSPAVRTIISLL